MGARARFFRFVPIAALALLTGACATGQEWVAWESHPAHFASFEHMRFSLRNGAGRAPRVTHEDVRDARAEHWWGDPVAVSLAQIVDR